LVQELKLDAAYNEAGPTARIQSRRGPLGSKYFTSETLIYFKKTIKALPSFLSL
jgi:hypothetical protein